MHSKKTPTYVRRMTPFLVTAGLGISAAAHAVQPPAEEVSAVDVAASEPAADDRKSENPAPTIDTDGDGKADAWDRSGDGKPDAWDTDGDGKPDLLDDNADGKPD